MKSPYVDTGEAARLLHFLKPSGEPDRARAWKWLERHRVPCKRRGRIYLYRPEDVEQTLEVVR